MKKQDNKGGFVVGILIGIFLMLVVVIVLFATNIISFKSNIYTSNDDSVKNDEVEKEDKVEDNSKLDNERYSSVIEEYRTAMSDSSYNDGIDQGKKYPNINTHMMQYYHSYGQEVVFKYVFYDINNDNKDEMIVGDGSNGIYEIYTYDGSKVVRFFNSVCLGERCGAQIYDSGIVYFNGSGGASVHVYSFYKIDNDGYSKETIKSYTAEYDESGNVTITDDVTKAVTSFKKSEELIASVVGNGKVIDLSKFNWIEIK